MIKYPSINNVFKRDGKTVLRGQFSQPEFEVLQDCPWHATEKLDGMNCQVCFNHEGEPIQFFGRNEKTSWPTGMLEHLQATFTQERLEKVFNSTTVTLYGEGVGGKIQKAAKHYGENPFFVLFDVRIGDYWLRYMDVFEIANSLEIPHVPYLGLKTLNCLIDWVTNGQTSLFEYGWNAEGIVAVPDCYLRNRNGDRIITKIKTRDLHKKGYRP